jgi:hypothetical protein
MTQIELIKAEIERRMKNNHQDATESGAGAFYEDKDILSFINSLPSEQTKLKVNYAGKIYDVIRIKELPCGLTMYGIEDGPNHIDYVLPENCEIISDYGYGVKEKGSPYPTKSVLFSEQPSEDLEKSADYYLDSIPTADLMEGSYDGSQVHDAFKAGANWQREQIMESAIEVKINRDTLYNLKPIIHEKYQDLKIGDKILIIKEDEQ